VIIYLHIKSSKKDKSLMLNICVSDFKAFLDSLDKNDGWVKFRIFERDIEDDRGFTHNMEVILNKVSS
jgi:hypothetical protein